MLFRTGGFKRLGFELLTATPLDAVLRWRIRRSRKTVVLNLHRVSPRVNPFWSPMHPRVFDDLVGYLVRHFDVTTFQDLPSRAGDRPTAILSFDDGYHDFLEYAVPVLRKHGVSANQNVVPACVQSGLAPWNVRLYDFLDAAPRSLVNRLRLPGFEPRLRAEDDRSKSRYGGALSRFLKQRPRSERDGLWPEIEKVMAELGDFPETRMLNAAEVRELAREVEIGAHSFSHESMGFEATEFFRADLERCFEYFRDVLDLPLKVYAFPNGSYRAELIEIAQQRGIEQLLLVDEKLAMAGQRVHPRLTIYGSTSAEARFQALAYRQLSVA